MTDHEEHGLDCAAVQDALPEWAHGSLGADRARGIDAHLGGCDACAAEARVVASLRASRAEPPPDLADRIRRALRSQAFIGAASRRASEARLGWAIAASVVLALAGSLTMQPGAEVSAEDELVASLGAAPDPWMEASTIAGAPVLEDLSDEALESLLRELEG